MAQSMSNLSSSRSSAIVVVGVSAGGMDALTRFVAQLPAEFPASIFVVHHMSADTTGEALVGAMNQHGKLPCSHPQDGERFVPGHIYLAPSDHHMMIARGRRILVTKGAAENRSRPAIDPLFRSAAVAYGNRVIGILLTGYLDDGTSGMSAIKRCGGTCVGSSADANGRPTHTKCDRVRHHVPRIGEQSQRMRHDSADGFDNHEDEDDEKREANPALVRHGAAMTMAGVTMSSTGGMAMAVMAS